MVAILLGALALLGSVRPPKMAGGTLARRHIVSVALAAASCHILHTSLPATAIPPLEMVMQAQVDSPPPQVLYTPPAVKGTSTPEALALAKHLKEKGTLRLPQSLFCLNQPALRLGSRAYPLDSLFAVAAPPPPLARR